MGPMAADGKDGDPMPSSRPREREGLIPNQILRKPPSRRQGINLPSIPPLHEQQRGSSREKSPDAGTSTCLSRPASLVLASQTPASPSSRPVVSKPIYHAANPTPSQIYFPPSHHTRLFSFLCNMSLPIHQPWGASPLTRRASSEAAELTKQASQVLPPVLSDCSTDLASQNLQQPVVERNDDIVPPLRHLTYHGPGGDGGGRPPLSPLLPPRDDDNAGT